MGRLPAGSPYLAMEQANGGTLHAACGHLDWASLRLLLLSAAVVSIVVMGASLAGDAVQSGLEYEGTSLCYR